jgi:hypothetical protein
MHLITALYLASYFVLRLLRFAVRRAKKWRPCQLPRRPCLSLPCAQWARVAGGAACRCCLFSISTRGAWPPAISTKSVYKRSAGEWGRWRRSALGLVEDLKPLPCHAPIKSDHMLWHCHLPRGQELAFLVGKIILTPSLAYTRPLEPCVDLLIVPRHAYLLLVTVNHQGRLATAGSGPTVMGIMVLGF